MPFFRIRDLEGGLPDRLVEAANSAQAVKHVAKRYDATILKTADVAKMMGAGVTHERAKADADATQAAIRG